MDEVPNTSPLDIVLAKFVQTFANYETTVSQHPLPLTNSLWQFDHFVHNANYAKTWFSLFYTKHRYNGNQSFLGAKHAFIFAKQSYPAT